MLEMSEILQFASPACVLKRKGQEWSLFREVKLP